MNDRINAHDLPSLKLADIQSVLKDQCSGLLSLVSLKDANVGAKTKTDLLVVDDVRLSWHEGGEAPILEAVGRAFLGDSPVTAVA